MIVKVCGLREPENIRDVSGLPVDMLGLIFYPASPRFIGRSGSNAFAPEIFGGKMKVGVFVNAPLHEVVGETRNYRLDMVQLHGDESPAYCREIFCHIPVIKTFRVNDGFDFMTTGKYQDFCSYFLFDTKGKGYGGTGRSFNWKLLERYRGIAPFILSGGIKPDRAAEVRQIDHPRFAGVDLNSGFEVNPGVKDTGKLNQFLYNIR